MLFDTHAHYDDAQFDNDRFSLLENLPNENIKFAVNIGTNYETSRASVEYAKRFPHIFATVGYHPEFADQFDVEKLRELVKLPKVVAVGEIGLDYHYEDNPPREVQISAFENQLTLAKELNLPACIHNRDAHKDVVDTLLSVDHDKIIIHCFSASLETAKIFVNKGYYISFAGTITFKNAPKLKEVAKYVPLDKLLIETDSPYLSPEPFRGKRNDSRNILYTAKALAEIKGVSFEEISDITFNNAKRIYNI